jgi:arsenate reductase
MAEAVLNRTAGVRISAESAGSRPAAQVNPYAIHALRELGIDWAGRPPRGLETVVREHWDLVITVCDRARDACPILPGHPVTAHWGMADPAEVEGGDATKRRAFAESLALIVRRIERLVALPLETLARSVVEARVREIGEAG